ncbi:MAG: hypothetical protein AAGF57_19705 [Pseudomonadota bacterium]
MRETTGLTTVAYLILFLSACGGGGGGNGPPPPQPPQQGELLVANAPSGFQLNTANTLEIQSISDVVLGDATITISSINSPPQGASVTDINCVQAVLHPGGTSCQVSVTSSRDFTLSLRGIVNEGEQNQTEFTYNLDVHFQQLYQMPYSIECASFAEASGLRVQCRGADGVSLSWDIGPGDALPQDGTFYPFIASKRDVAREGVACQGDYAVALPGTPEIAAYCYYNSQFDTYYRLELIYEFELVIAQDEGDWTRVDGETGEFFYVCQEDDANQTVNCPFTNRPF